MNKNLNQLMKNSGFSTYLARYISQLFNFIFDSLDHQNEILCKYNLSLSNINGLSQAFDIILLVST